MKEFFCGFLHVNRENNFSIFFPICSCQLERKNFWTIFFPISSCKLEKQNPISRRQIYKNWEKFFPISSCQIEFGFWSNANQIDQLPITANGALSTRRLSNYDWLVISSYINIYQLMNIIVSSKKSQMIFTRRK